MVDRSYNSGYRWWFSFLFFVHLSIKIFLIEDTCIPDGSERK